LAAKQIIKNRGLIGFVALVPVGQQFYRLVLNTVINYTVGLL